MVKQVVRFMTFKNISVPATLLTVALLAGCQTSSPSSVLSSVLPGNKNDSQSQTTTAEDSALKTGQNPNAANRLKNTRTALSDSLSPTNQAEENDGDNEHYSQRRNLLQNAKIAILQNANLVDAIS